MTKNILELKNILKVYPNGIVANHDVNFSLRKGEIHALAGENGAGKSTLMKILFGIEHPEEGDIILKGEKIKLNDSKEAINYGIGMVHQHFMLVDSLSVAENISLGMEPKTKFGLLDSKNMLNSAQEIADEYNFKLNPTSLVGDLSVGLKQKVEILKALIRGAEILILDEPTAVLTPQETKELFDQLLYLKSKGHTIVFISHKLEEIMQICDRVTIMKKGRTIKTMNVVDTSPEEISREMVGRDVKFKFEKKPLSLGDKKLEFKNISYVNNKGEVLLDDISFSAKGGLILGVAGIEGNGQAEIAKLASGIVKPTKGEILLNGKLVNKLDVSSIRDRNLRYIPEDRMIDGIAKKENIMNNIIADKINMFLKKKIFIDYSKTIEYTEDKIKDFYIKCGSYKDDVDMLSGGNIQKVVAAREVGEPMEVLIAEQPTRGIDPGAAELIREKLIDLRDEGTTVILISADLNELLELSDSVMVMYSGKVNGYFEDASRLSEEELGYYMLGVKKDNLCGEAVNE